jgi:ribosome-associated translation inhibitor RaiA
MDELDFTLEMNTELEDAAAEAGLFAEADNRLRALAADHDDLTGAAINLRQTARRETPLLEATVVVYARPENIAATEKAETPEAALKGALEAVERQVRQQRDRLRERWAQPDNEPRIQEMIDVSAAEQARLDAESRANEDTEPKDAT